MTNALAAAPTSPRRRVPGLYTAAWMGFQSGLPERLRNDPTLTAFARRTKWWRRGTFWGMLLLPYAWVFVTGADDTTPNFGVIFVVAWFVARIVPELFARHRSPTATRVARLGDRSPLRYVPDTGRRWLLASFALGVAAIIAGRIWPATSIRHDLTPLGLSALVAVTSGTAIVRIARRSHPAGGPDDLLVDDAIRRLATTSVVAAWAALQFLVTFWLLPTGPIGTGDNLHAGVGVGLTYLAAVGVVAAHAWVPTRVERAHG